MNNKKNTGFTLIELLIVVAIIAILAAIAIPNFLAAQVRSKVSRVKSNMRTAATAIESYKVDTNEYPCIGGSNVSSGLPNCVSTPIAYVTRVPDDIFDVFRLFGPGVLSIKYKSENYYGGDGFYVNTGSGNLADDVQVKSAGANPTNIKYVVFSMGPGQKMAHLKFGTGFYNLPGEPYGHWPDPHRYWYDPTNGVVTLGYVVRDSGGRVSP
jgi:prepilin-type N-terminal cleavage/methylation domain-containing protein